MVQGFYELLGAAEDASREELEAAFRRSLAEVGQRLRRVRASGGDTAALEAQAEALHEAWSVLGDPERRRAYDLYRRLSAEELDPDPVELWNRIWPARIGAEAASAMAILGLLTDLPVGDLSRTPAPAPRSPQRAPQPVPVSLLSDEEREARARAAVAPVPDRGAPPAARPRELAPEEVAQLVTTYGMDGRLLRAVREALGLSMDEVASTTRIASRYIAAIETNAFDRLPAGVFVKGYVRALAQLYRLDVQAVVEGYMQRFSDHGGR